jgi:hypothetical protein
MAKTDHKGRAKGEFKHVRQQEWLLKSPAYRSLTCVDRCLLIELYRKYTGINNGEIFLSCREAAELLNVSKATAARAFRSLEECGFIRLRGKASFSMKGKMASTWVLTEFDFAGAIATKDFIKWRPQNLKHGLTRGTDCPSGETLSPRRDREEPSSSHQRDTKQAKSTPHGLTTGTQIVYQEGGGDGAAVGPADTSRDEVLLHRPTVLRHLCEAA